MLRSACVRTVLRMIYSLLVFILVSFFVEGSVYTMIPLGILNFSIAFLVSVFVVIFRFDLYASYISYFSSFFAFYSLIFIASDFVAMKWRGVVILDGGALTQNGWMYVFVLAMLFAAVPTLLFPAEPKRR